MTDPFERLEALEAQVRDDRRRARGHGARTPAADHPPGRGRGWTAVRRWARRLLAGVAALVLPLLVLVRGATWLYGSQALGTWSAVAGGAGLAFLLLAAYGVAAAWWYSGRTGAPFNVPRWLIRGAAFLVVAYCGYGLVYLSGANAKTDAVRSEYRTLHPVLRLAVGTLVLADGEALVTDASRAPAEYAAMGLSANEASLHLEQEDGYAHAVDLRTLGRSGIRNALTRLYFAGLGFRTLRHVGTADHLHVSLPVVSRRR